jgi:hypothetical protein
MRFSRKPLGDVRGAGGGSCGVEVVVEMSPVGVPGGVGFVIVVSVLLLHYSLRTAVFSCLQYC